MGFGFIAAGLCFLFNPNISVFDVLPDFIGYMLIYHGLFQMSFSSPKLQETRSSIWKLALITALRILSLIFLPYTSVTFNLVLVFVFGVLETVYFIPAVLGMFEGFYHLGIRCGTDSVYDAREIRRTDKDGNSALQKTEYAERLKIYTIVFFFIKTVASVLPELTALQGEGYAADTSLGVNLIQFKPLFYGFCAVIVTVFGIIWLIRILRYVGRMKRDTVLCGKISEFFAENVSSNPAIMAAMRMKKVHILLVLSAACTMIFLVDGVDIILNAFASVCLILALVMMYRDAENPALMAGSITAAVAAAVLSAVNLIIQIPYFEEYEAMSARYIAGAAQAYKTVRFWGAAEYVLVLIMFALALTVYCRVIKKHASYVNITGGVTQFTADARRAELLSGVYSRILLAGIVGVIYFLLGAVYFTAAMYLTEIFLVNAIVCLIWIAAVAQIGTAAYENVYERLEQNY